MKCGSKGASFDLANFLNKACERREYGLRMTAYFKQGRFMVKLWSFFGVLIYLSISFYFNRLRNFPSWAIPWKCQPHTFLKTSTSGYMESQYQKQTYWGSRIRKNPFRFHVFGHFVAYDRQSTFPSKKPSNSLKQSIPLHILALRVIYLNKCLLPSIQVLYKNQT